jgi:hypothetical protein
VKFHTIKKNKIFLQVILPHQMDKKKMPWCSFTLALWKVIYLGCML